MLEAGGKLASWKEKSQSFLRGRSEDFSPLDGGETPQSPEEKWENFKNSSKRFTWKQRLIGLGVCWGLAFVFITMAFVFGFAIISTFIIAYSLANVFFILGSFFIISPRKQVKHICAPKRIIASVLYFGSLILTIVFAVVVENSGAAVVMMLIQICALVWYIASFIPYARTLMKKTCCSCCFPPDSA